MHGSVKLTITLSQPSLFHTPVLALKPESAYVDGAHLHAGVDTVIGADELVGIANALPIGPLKDVLLQMVESYHAEHEVVRDRLVEQLAEVQDRTKSLQ